MSSKRSEPRLRRRLKISLGGRLPAFTADVSPGGFSAEAMQPLRPGAKVEGSITADGCELSFAGEVTWSKAGEPRASVRGQFGVRFTNAGTEFRARLRNALAPGSQVPGKGSGNHTG